MAASVVEASHPRQRRAVALVAQGAVLPQMDVAAARASGAGVNDLGQTARRARFDEGARFARVAFVGRGVTVAFGARVATRADVGRVGGGVRGVVHDKDLRGKWAEVGEHPLARI